MTKKLLLFKEQISVRFAVNKAQPLEEPSLRDISIDMMGTVWYM